MFKVTIDGDLAEGTTKILDLTKSEYKGFAQYLSLEYQKDKYRVFVINGGYQFVLNTNPINMPLPTGRAIGNTTNYECTLSGGFKLYVIIDRDSLSDELKAQFDTNGIYTYTANKRANSANWVANLQYELRKVTKKLDCYYLPTKFLEAADKEEILGNIVNADWAQNDTSAKDYIKNRTHYEEEVENTITMDTGKFWRFDEELLDGLFENRATATYYSEYNYECFYMGDIEGTKNFYIGNDSVKYVAARVGETYEFTIDGSNGVSTFEITYKVKETVYHKLESKYLPNYLTSPLLLDADSAESYLNDSAIGDEALEAIKHNRQILVKVPNASGDSYVVNYSPVYMHQLPNYQNKYLYLFFLRDEKQDLSALLGLPTGSVQMPTYGQLKMLLSQEYNSNPLV